MADPRPPEVDPEDAPLQESTGVVPPDDEMPVDDFVPDEGDADHQEQVTRTELPDNG